LLCNYHHHHYHYYYYYLYYHSTYCKQEENTAKVLLAIVVALTLAQSGVSVWFSYVGRGFWTALSAKNEAEFYEVLQRFLGALVVGMPVTVMYKFQRQKLALGWREWLTTRIMKVCTVLWGLLYLMKSQQAVCWSVEEYKRSMKVSRGMRWLKGGCMTMMIVKSRGGISVFSLQLYYANRNYYSLEASKEVDNPDARIAEDIRAFTKDSLDLLITALTAVIDLGVSRNLML